MRLPERAVRPNVVRPLSTVVVDSSGRFLRTTPKPYPTARIPTNPGIAPRIASKNNRSRAG